MKVLVVEDDRNQREVRSLLLARSGFVALEAGDANSAKVIAAEHLPHVAIVDLGLPTIDDGLELIRDLKRQNPGMRVIVLTGRRRNSFENRPGADLIDQLLMKPASTAALIQALRSLLGDLY
jgi:DNA-binding response OmpR family regulator